MSATFAWLTQIVGEHIVGAERRRLPLGETQGGRGFVVAAGLREHHARERMHQREMTAIAGGVQRGGRLGDVLAHDRVSPTLL